jgi:hypothetical protein
MLSINTGSPAKAPPKTFTCYLCQRAYGSASISIHIKSCRAAFLAGESAKPLRERRALPEEPADYSAAASWTTEEVEAANSVASSQANSMLSSCENCGRTFLPDRLLIHSRSCTRDRPARPVAARSESAPPLPPIPPLTPTRRRVAAARPSNTEGLHPSALAAQSLGLGGERGGGAVDCYQLPDSALIPAYKKKEPVLSAHSNSDLSDRVAAIAARLASFKSFVATELNFLTEETRELALIIAERK